MKSQRKIILNKYFRFQRYFLGKSFVLNCNYKMQAVMKIPVIYRFRVKQFTLYKIMHIVRKYKNNNINMYINSFKKIFK